MDLWERGIHAGLVGDADAEGATREGRAVETLSGGMGPWGKIFR